MEHVILDAMLAVEEHDDHAAISVPTLKYEDVDSPTTESAVLEMFFRSRITWHRWSLVVDALQKVFKGDYVKLMFDVEVIISPAELMYIGSGTLYNPKDA